jgi:hypothetical protein
VGRTWREENAYNILIEKPDGKRFWETLLIHMRADVDAVMNILVP